MTTPTNSHKHWTDKGGHVRWTEQIAGVQQQRVGLLGPQLPQQARHLRQGREFIHVVELQQLHLDRFGLGCAAQ